MLVNLALLYRGVSLAILMAAALTLLSVPTWAISMAPRWRPIIGCNQHVELTAMQRFEDGHGGLNSMAMPASRLTTCLDGTN
jgi:hypothetical protein